ncbi:MAG: HEAT repeat domain-containing protein [Planctomycetota bacterium]
MVVSSRVAALPLILLLGAMAGLAGCTREAAKPKEAVAAAKPAPTPAPAPAAPAAPAAAPAPQPAEAGANGVSELIATLTTSDDSDARVVAIDEIATKLRGGLPALDALVASLADQEPRVRWHAARAIGLIGHEAKSAIPALVKRLADEDGITVTQAAAAIGHIRSDDDRPEIPAADAEVYAAAIEPLVGTMVHPDPRARRAAVRALKAISTSREELAKTVRRQLADADPAAVLPALHTLADLEEDAVPFLLEALQDPKSRFWAEVVIAEIGEEAAAAVEPLVTIATEGAVEERVQAILALAEIGKPAVSAAPQLVAALESPDESLQYVAAYALGKLRAAAGDAALEKAATADDQFLATIATWSRARIHPDDASLRDKAVERLEAELADEAPAMRQAAVDGLSGLADALDEAGRRKLAARFAGLLVDPVPAVGLAAGGALIRLGADAVDALREQLATPAARNDAMEILAELGPVAKPALAEMIAGLADQDPVYRSDSAMAIAALGPEAVSAAPALEKLLADESVPPPVRYTAAYGLGRIGPQAAAAEPLLRKLAESDDDLLATVAVWAALKLKPDDATLFDAAVPKLRQALKDEQELVRLEAAVALGEIGAAAGSALPLLELLAEEDPARAVRAAASEAVERVRGPR